MPRIRACTTYLNLHADTISTVTPRDQSTHRLGALFLGSNLPARVVARTQEEGLAGRRRWRVSGGQRPVRARELLLGGGGARGPFKRAPRAVWMDLAQRSELWVSL